jgi:dTDP-4-dehydrorhamnose reductase
LNRILILGGSGFVGNALYKELLPFYNVHCTYRTPKSSLDKNRHFHEFDMETEDISILLDNLKPQFIISALRGNHYAQIDLHKRLSLWCMMHESRIIFLSSANVFDRFTNYPSYEHDKTLSESVYGRLKIKIENDLLRMPANKYVICRVPMIYGSKSPRIQEIKAFLAAKQAIEVFPNVVINATYIDILASQVHYIINRRRRGIFHLGSSDLVHHIDLVRDICSHLGTAHPLLKQVYDSNEDRHLAVLPKDNLLPKHLQLTIAAVVASATVV